MAVGANPDFISSPRRPRGGISLTRAFAIASVVLCALARIASPVAADDRYAVRAGQAYFYFNVGLLHDLGLDLVVEGDAVEPGIGLLIEEPRWAFPIRKGSDFGFHSDYGVIRSGGLVGSSILLGGAITVRDIASGKQTRLDGLEISRLPLADISGQHGTETLALRSAATGQVFCELEHSMLDLRPGDQMLQVHYLNARVDESWANSIGRPDLAGWVIGGGEVRAALTLVASSPPTEPRYQPQFTGGILDVGLGDLSSIQQVGHIGTFPTGTAGLSMSTTICNFGTVEVPWLAPMLENHPVIHMALYRLLNGRFEQVGIAWLKHGFFATSNSQCTTCQNPSDGSYLALGCSDTYGVSNNSDRNFLGPRNEVNPFSAEWECQGSYFSGGPAFPDCIRRAPSGGLSAIDHRLVVADADLNNPGATYYYEACYLVRDDQSLTNNWGSRRCTMSWGGSTWSFNTPNSGNPLLAGPAIGRWGELSTTVNAATGDGEVTLAVQTTDLGGGTFHYEYALFNKNSNRQLRSFSIPVTGIANITNIGYHDNDGNASNDWTVTVANGVITWQCATFATDSTAHSLVYGNLINLRFDADSAPVARDATLGLFRPGTGTEVAVATRGPAFGVVGVEEGVAASRPRLIDMRPNPFNHSTTIAYELARPGSVKLEIYDAAGRLVRTLIDATGEAGVHSAVWDGNADGGTRARAGVYHARLRTGNITSVRSLILVN